MSYCPHMTSKGKTLMNQDSPALIEALRNLRPGLVVDVGALDGRDAVDFARAGHRVWSFEAMPNKLDSIRNRLQTTQTSHRVTLHAVALSNYTGTGHFVAHANWAGDDSFADAKNTSGQEVIDVPTRTLDSFVNADTQIALTKIDAQGYDFRVLRGATALLASRRIARVVFEFTPAMMPGGAAEAEEHLRWMLDMGYACAPCNAVWSRVHVGGSSAPRSIAAYVQGYWFTERRTQRSRLRGFDNIVCVPRVKCNACDKLKP